MVYKNCYVRYFSYPDNLSIHIGRGSSMCWKMIHFGNNGILKIDPKIEEIDKTRTRMNSLRLKIGGKTLK